MGAFISGTEYLLGQQLRQHILSEPNDLWERVDALVWPSTFRTAFGVGAPQTFAGQHTRLTNLTGTPSLSLPCGLDDVGLPVGIQINGRAHDDHLVLSLGAALERASEHHDVLPSVTEVMPPLPPDLRFAPPTAPEGVGTLELAALEDGIRRGLARLDVGLVEEDLSVFVYRLHEFRRNLREAVPGLQSRR